MTSVSMEPCAPAIGHVLLRCLLAVSEWKDKYFFKEQVPTAWAPRRSQLCGAWETALLRQVLHWVCKRTEHVAGPRPTQAARACRGDRQGRCPGGAPVCSPGPEVQRTRVCGRCPVRRLVPQGAYETLRLLLSLEVLGSKVPSRERSRAPQVSWKWRRCGRGGGSEVIAGLPEEPNPLCLTELSALFFFFFKNHLFIDF